MEMRRVVVTGLGSLTPIGNNVEQYWQGLINGVSGAAPITHFDASQAKTQFACEVKDFDASQFFDRKEARKYDKFSQYGIVAATQAMENCGIDLEKLDKDRAGVIWASGMVVSSRSKKRLPILPRETELFVSVLSLFQR